MRESPARHSIHRCRRDAMTTITHGEVLLRLTVVVVLCGAVGLERQARDQVAGLRTHIIVGLGAALFTLVSAYAFAGAGSSHADPTPIAAQVVSGIGSTVIRSGYKDSGHFWDCVVTDGREWHYIRVLGPDLGQFPPLFERGHRVGHRPVCRDLAFCRPAARAPEC
jgi:hypothetical protein